MGIGSVFIALTGLVVVVAIIVMLTKKQKHHKTYQEKIAAVVTKSSRGSMVPGTFEENLAHYQNLIRTGAYSSAELACRSADGQHFYECLAKVYGQ